MRLNPLTLAAGVTVGVLLAGVVKSWLAPLGSAPWYSIGQCAVCGGWENFAARHGGLFNHLMGVFVGFFFLFGIFYLFADMQKK